MRRITTLTTGALGVLLTAAALAGCSSSGKKDDAKSPATSGTSSSAGATPTKDAQPANGHLAYTGDSTGSADFTSGIACEVKAGRLIGVTAPDPSDKKASKQPEFIATAAGPQKLALLDTSDKKHYDQRESGTVSGHKSGGVWTVTVTNLKVADAFSSTPKAITVSGSLTCTKTT